MNKSLTAFIVCIISSASLIACGEAPSPAADDECRAEYAPFACRVLSFKAGAGAGFGQDKMPEIVLGPPNPQGESISTDVLSLGMGGEITIELANTIIDGEGPDFIIFENPFVINGSTSVFKELGLVSVSEDGELFHEFACDPASSETSHCAGAAPVFANTTAQIPADNPMVSGGDLFDLSDIAQSRARFIKIVDLKSVFGADGKAGFDLDAIIGLHSEAQP